MFLVQPDDNYTYSGQNMDKRIAEQNKKIAELEKKVADQDKKNAEQDENMAEIVRNVELIQSVVAAEHPGSKALLEGNRAKGFG